ncbi:MAG: FAD-dependent oxidoreductase, partial [Caldimonas sp.]
MTTARSTGPERQIDAVHATSETASASVVDVDAVIVGAGPAGSSAAILLARAGWSVALVERQRFPRRKVCGECIAASNLPLLAGLGLGAAIDAQAGPPLRRVALMRGDRTVVADLPAAASAAHRWGRALGRETLDTLLLEQARAAGVAIWQPWSVQALEGGAGA